MFTRSWNVVDKNDALFDNDLNEQASQRSLKIREFFMVRKFAILLAMVAMYGCLPAKDESAVKTGSAYPVDMQISSYTTAGLSNFLIPSAYAAVSDLQLCFKRLRFKQDLTDTLDPLVEDNIDLNLGLVSLSSAGTDLPVVNVPAGTYYLDRGQCMVGSLTGAIS